MLKRIKKSLLLENPICFQKTAIVQKNAKGTDIYFETLFSCKKDCESLKNCKNSQK